MLIHDKIILVWGCFIAWWYAKNLLLKDLAYGVIAFFFIASMQHQLSYELRREKTCLHRTLCEMVQLKPAYTGTEATDKVKKKKKQQHIFCFMEKQPYILKFQGETANISGKFQREIVVSQRKHGDYRQNVRISGRNTGISWRKWRISWRNFPLFLPEKKAVDHGEK